MKDRESGIEDYLGFLQSLWSKHPSQFLFGGQAVNFWAEYFDRQSGPGKLDGFRPFTSKDCDVWVSAAVWKEIKHEERDRLVCGSSPADGQLGLLTLQRSPLRVVDLLSGVYGFRQEELARLCGRSPVFSGVIFSEVLETRTTFQERIRQHPLNYSHRLHPSGTGHGRVPAGS